MVTGKLTRCCAPSQQLSMLYENALKSADSNVHVSCMRAVSSYLTVCDTPKEMKPLQAMLPTMLAVVGTALQTDEANARALLDSMIDIASTLPRFFKPQLKEIAAAMLEHVAMNKNLEAPTRRLALEVTKVDLALSAMRSFLVSHALLPCRPLQSCS